MKYLNSLKEKLLANSLIFQIIFGKGEIEEASTHMTEALSH